MGECFTPSLAVRSNSNLQMSAPAGEKVFLRQGHLLTKVRDDDHSGYPSLVPEQLLVVKLSNSASDIRVLGTTQACDAPTVVRHEFEVHPYGFLEVSQLTIQGRSDKGP